MVKVPNWLGGNKKKDTITGIFEDDEELGAVAPSVQPVSAGPAETLHQTFDQKSTQTARPVALQDFSQDNFFILSDLLKSKYNSGAELKNVMKPVPVSFVDQGQTVAVRIKGHDHSFTVGEKGVRADIDPSATMTVEAAVKLAELAKTTGTNGKPVVLKGSDENKIMLYLAAQQSGLNVKNAAEIDKLQQKNPQLVQAVQQRWATHAAKAVFEQPVGLIALNLNVVDAAERERAGKVQAELVAISLKRQDVAKDDKTDLFGLMRNDDARKAMIEKLGVTHSEMNAASQIASTQGKGVPNDVPKFFMIANIPQDAKNLILQAQADVRALGAIDRVKKGASNDMPQAEFDKMFSMVGNPKFKEPQEVVHAQERNMNVTALETQVARGADVPVSAFISPERSAVKSLNTAAQAVAQMGHRDLAAAMMLVAQSHAAPAAPASGAPNRNGGPA